MPLDPDYLFFLIAWIQTNRSQAKKRDRKVSMQRQRTAGATLRCIEVFLSFLIAWIDTGRSQAVTRDRKVWMQRHVAQRIPGMG